MSLTLLFDDFSGSSIDPATWHYPTGEVSYYGKTQIRPAYPSVSDGAVHLQLDTYNPTANTPGDSFFGSEIVSNQTFARGVGLTVEFEARLVSPLSPGLVGGGFLYEISGGPDRHNEIDYELLSNFVKPNADDDVLTNIYVEQPLDEGKPVSVSIPGLDVTSLNVYRIEWHQDRVLWFINNIFVREESDLSPSDNLELRFNLWVPDSNVVQAYSSLLQPVSNSASNKTFFFDVDWVRVSDNIDFQPLDYIASYTDLIETFALDAAAATQHYVDHGRNEGRSIQFESLEYIASYPDLMGAVGANASDGATHYILYGRTEGRTVTFDGLQYIASYGDLIEAFGANQDAGSTHYIGYGAGEGRAKDSFDAKQYLSNYFDLQKAFGANEEAATVHFITSGYAEGRSDEPLTTAAVVLDFLI